MLPPSHQLSFYKMGFAISTKPCARKNSFYKIAPFFWPQKNVDKVCLKFAQARGGLASPFCREK